MSKSKLAKDIKESTKILSYLGRAEKYFDLELVKNGRPTKPLLMIADIIDQLRQISEVATRIENNDPLPQYATEAFNDYAKICQVADDIVALNPRGLVSSDKATLGRLRANITAIQEKAALSKNFAPRQIIEEPVYESITATRVIEEYQFPAAEPEPTPAVQNVSYNFDLPPEPINLYQAPANNYLAQQDRYSLANNPEPTPQYSESAIMQTAPANNLYQIHPSRNEVSYNSGNYLATTYPGLNIQEAADIIEELANNPKNHNVVLLEHASQTKPIAMGMDIIADLRALVPIADAIENSTEILNKEPIKILSKVDQIISICADISALSIDGLDLRRKKLLSRFVRQDLLKLASVARNAYPEAFSPTTDNFGELATSTLVDFAELLTAKARFHEDRLYAEILSQVAYQVAEYANYNEVRSKFDVIIKKNRINSSPKTFDTKIKMAWLRAVTFVPQIARHAQEIATLVQTNDLERRLIEKSLEILQLAYIDARDKYTAYLQEFAQIKAA